MQVEALSPLDLVGAVDDYGVKVRPDILAARFEGVVRVLACRLEEAEARLEKLAKKARRYGNADVAWVRGDRWSETVSRQGRKVSIEYVNLHVVGEPLRVGPFEFLAKIEPLEAGVNLVHTAPGKSCDERFRSSTMVCEHCDTLRGRRECFVVGNVETGEQRQIGRNCLADYIGTNSPARLVSYFGFLADVKDMDGEFGWGSFGRNEGEFTTAEVLAWTATAIRLWGWCSKGDAEREGRANRHVNPTSHWVKLALGWIREDKYNRADKLALKEAHDAERDFAAAEEVIAWARSEALSGTSEYEYNLKTILGRDLITSARHFGLACSAVSAFARYQERELRRTIERQEASASFHVGAEGERLKGMEVALLSSKAITSDWGTTVLHKFRRADGAVFTWFATAETDMARGEIVKLTGTVKRHTDRDGAKETQLTRCKVEPIKAAAQ